MFVRREDAERFIEEVRGDLREIAAMLRIEKRELESGVGQGVSQALRLDAVRSRRLPLSTRPWQGPSSRGRL